MSVLSDDFSSRVITERSLLRKDRVAVSERAINSFEVVERGVVGV